MATGHVSRGRHGGRVESVVQYNLTDFRILAFKHFMCDALELTDAVFKLMQVKDFNFSDVHTTITVRL